MTSPCWTGSARHAGGRSRPTGNNAGTGWIAHQTLAVDPANRHVLGLVRQILHVRESPASAAKMAALVALLSVVAVGLMNLRLAVRSPEWAERPASEVVPAVWVEVLSRQQKGKPERNWSVAQFWVALARLGGYQKNSAKHPPGWITLWRGWSQLHPLIRYHLSIAKMT